MAPLGAARFGWASSGGVPELAIEYVVLAGGGGGAKSPHYWGIAGGGGGGGYRSSISGESTGGGGTLESTKTFTNGTSYTITVGGGGPGGGGYAGLGTRGGSSEITGSDITTVTSPFDMNLKLSISDTFPR